jgi:hypothetical protein
MAFSVRQTWLGIKSAGVFGNSEVGKKMRWYLLLAALLLWFYGGAAYLRWILPAKFSGFRGSEVVVVVSPGMDRILASDLVVIPLLFLNGLPIQLANAILMEASAALSGGQYTVRDFENNPRPFHLVSPLIVSLAFTFLFRLMAWEIRRAFG